MPSAVVLDADKSDKGDFGYIAGSGGFDPASLPVTLIF